MGTNNYSVLSRAKKLWTILAVMLISLPSFYAVAQSNCPVVTNLAVTNLQPTSAKLQWTPSVTGNTWYDLRVSTVEITSADRATATAENEGMVVFANQFATSQAEYQFNGLEPGTHYYVYFRHNRQKEDEGVYDGTAAWQSLEFSTPCLATSVLPQAASFDDSSNIPSCWCAGGSNPTIVGAQHYGESGNSAKLSSVGAVSSYLYSPVFLPSAQAYYLTMRLYATSANTICRVGYAGAEDLSAVTQIGEAITISVANTWVSVDVVIPEEVRAEIVGSEAEYVWCIYSSNGDEATFFVDEVVIDQMPTCIAPNGLHIEGVAANEATLAWNERGTATAWTIAYTAVDSSDTLEVVANANHFTVSGLETTTAYKFRVKAVCSASDESNWTDWVSVTTTCGAVALPYETDFEANDALECWTLPATGVTRASASSYANSGTYALKFATSNDVVVVLPPVSNLNGLQMSFFWRCEGSSNTTMGYLQAGYVTNPEDASTFVMLADYDTHVYTYTEQTVVFAGVPANACPALRYHDATSASWFLFVDDVTVETVPTCGKPANLHLDGFDSESATLAWAAGINNETKWNLTYALNEGELQTVEVNGTPAYVIDGLEPATDYTLSNLSVQAVCGADDNSKVVTAANITFKTACALQSLPFAEGFEGTTFAPDCWYTGRLEGTEGGWSRNTSSGYYHSGAASAKLADVHAGNRNILTTPMFHSEAANTVRFSFWMKRDDATKEEEGVRVWVNTVPNDTLGGTALLHVTRAYAVGGEGIKVPAEAAAGWYKYGAEIPVAGDLYLIFEGISEWGAASYIDDVVVEYVPTCDNPIYALTVGKLAHEATLSWANANHNSQWELKYKVGSNDLESVLVNDTVYTIEGLSANTQYTLSELAIRVICAEGDTSAWNSIDNITFQTSCEAMSLPLVEDFNDVLLSIPSCWNQSENTFTNANYNWGIYPDVSINRYGATGGTTPCLVLDSYYASSGQYGALKTPIFNVPTARQVEVSFAYKNPEGGDFSVYLSRDGGNTYTEALATGLINQAEWTTATCFFQAIPTDNLCVVFKGTSNYGGGDAYIYLDDVEIKAPLCARPSGFSISSVSAHEASIQWNTSTANSYQVLLFAANAQPSAAANALVNEEVTTNAATFDNLEANHLYYVYVKGSCEEEGSEWSKVFTFRTECEAELPPYNEGFEEDGAHLCWQVIGGAENTLINASSVQKIEGAKSLNVSAGDNNVTLVSPRIDVENLAEYRLGLAVLSAVRDTITVYITDNPSDPAEFGQVGEIILAPGVWNEYSSELTVEDFEGNAHYIVIIINRGSNLFVDAVNVALPAACTKPTGVNYLVEGQDVQITWTSDAAAWNVEILDEAEQVVSTTLVTEQPFIPTGLDANTQYGVHVQAICGEDLSAWSVLVPFKTPCNLESLPYEENFDGIANVPNAAYSKGSDDVVLPDCWSMSYSGSNLISVANTTSTTLISAQSGNNALVFSGSQEAYLFLPSFDSNISLSFAYRMESSSSSGTFEIGYVTAAGDASTFVAVQTVEKSYSYTTANAILAGSQALYPVIKFIPGSSSYYAAIDNISVVEGPACPAPRGLTVSNPTTSSIDVVINDGDESHTAWELVAVVKDADPATGTPVAVGAKEATVALTLVSGVTYDFYVRAVCGEGEVSDWSAAQSLKFVEGVYSLVLNDGTSTDQYVPFYGYNADYGNQRSQFIIPAADLTTIPANTEITGITFFAQQTAKDYGGMFYVRFLEVEDAAFSTSDFVEVTNDALYAGSLVLVDGMIAIEFAEGYAYQGGNLLVDVTQTTEGNYFATNFYGVEAAGASISAYSTSTTSGMGTAALRGFAPKVELTYEIIDPNACAKPRISVDGVTAASAVLYVENATNWEYVLNDVSSTPIAVSGDSVIINNLEPTTSYTVFVRNVCAENNKSAWVSATFTTECAAVSVAVEDFESLENGTLSQCWAYATTSSMGLYIATGDDAAAGNYALNLYPSATDQVVIFISPELANNVNEYQLRFKVKTDAEATVTAYVGETNGIEEYNNATLALVTEETIAVSANYVEYFLPLTAYTGEGHYVFIKIAGLPSQGDLYIDDVVIESLPDCVVPAQLSVSGVADNSATVVISDAENNTWEYVVNDVNAEPTTITADTISLNDLEPATSYTVYVRRVCGGDNVSEWRSVRFKTLCSTMSLPFNEDFDAYEGVATGTYTTAPVWPDCWDFVNNNASASDYPQAFISSNSGYNVSGNALFMKSKANEEMYAILPAINTENDVKVSFFYRNEGTTDYNGTLSFGYYIEATGAFEALTTCERVVSMTSVRVTVPYRAGARLAFCYTGGTSNNYYCSVDNIIVNELAACEAPDAISVATVTDSSVDIVITDAVAEHNAWEVVIVDHEADVTTGTPVALDTKAATLAGEFVSQVEHDLYVRAVCGENDASAWTGPVTFKYVDMSTIAPFPIAGDGNYPWTLSESGDRMESTNQGVHSSNSDLVATITVAEGMRATVSFNYWVVSEANYDYLCMYIDQTTPSTSNYETLFGKKGGSTADTGTYSFLLTEGTHQVRWRYSKDGSTNTGDDKAQVWGFTIEYEDYFAAPTVTPVTNLTAESATLNWSAAVAAVSNEVRLRTVQAGLDTIYTNLTGSSLDVEGLQANTEYAVTARSINANDDTTAWSTTYRFTTPCVAMDLPFAEDFEAVTTIPECWTNTHLYGSSSTLWSVSSNAAYINYQTAGNIALLATPQFRVQAGVTYRFMFKTSHSLYSDYDDETHIYLANSASDDSIALLCNIKYGEFPSGTNEHYYLFTPETDMNICLVVKRIFDGDTSFSLDDVVIEEAPACAAPQKLAVVNAEATNLVVSISDADAAHNAWQVAIVAHEETIDTTALALVESAVASIPLATPLVGGNTYDIYVRTACGENETSEWAGPLVYKFTDYTGIADGMTISGDGEYPWEIVEENGIQKLQSTNRNVASSSSDMITTVVVEEGKVGILNFNYYVQSEANYDYLCLYINTSVPSSDNYNADFGKKSGSTGVSGSYSIILTEAGTYTIRWRYYKDSSGNTGIDAAQVWNLSYTAGVALPPTGIELVSAVAHEATILWDAVASADKYEVRLAGEIFETLTDTITLTGLETNTAYTINVRAILGSDTTAWSEPFTFRTGCEASALPLATSFEEADGGLSCWTIHQIATGTGSGSDYGDEGWQINTRATDTGEPSSFVHTGLASAQLRDQKAGTHVLLASPELNAVEGMIQISFWVYRSNSSYGGSPKQEEGIRVWVNNTNTTTEGGTALVHVPRQYSVGGTDIKVAPVAEEGWYQYTAITPMTQANGNFYVLFEGINEYATSTYMDDVRIAAITAAEPFEETICKNENEGYEGHGFNISADQLQEGLNTFTRVEFATSDLVLDVAYTLNLYVNMPSQNIISDTICAGNAYSGYGFNIASPETRTYERHATNVAGCDSTVLLSLFVRPTQFTETATICEGETYAFAGENLTSAGTYSHTFANAYCDSIVTLTLNVLPKEIETIDATINAGETYTENGFNVTEEGTYTQTVIGDNGCDKTIILNLTVLTTGLNNDMLNTIEIVPTLLNKGGYAQIHHSFSAAQLAGMSVKVYDVVGQLVQEAQPAEGQLQVGGLTTSGLYIVKVQTADNKQYIGQIVVK